MQVLITGGTGGIGFAIASQFAAEGHSVVIADLQQDAIDSKVAQLRQQGYQAEGIVLDVTDAASITSCANRFQVDILVNNAGIQHVARLEDFPPEKWAMLINVMLTGPAMLSRAMLPAMRQRNFGRIINIGSIHALVASPFKSAYVAAKHGIVGFTKTLALELATAKITANSICPGYVLTPLVEAQIPDQMKAYHMDRETVIRDVMLDKQPTKEFVTTAQIGAVAAFLASDAAAQINGAAIPVDGGWTAE